MSIIYQFADKLTPTEKKNVSFSLKVEWKEKLRLWLRAAIGEQFELGAVFDSF